MYSKLKTKACFYYYLRQNSNEILKINNEGRNGNSMFCVTYVAHCYVFVCVVYMVIRIA